MIKGRKKKPAVTMTAMPAPGEMAETIDARATPPALVADDGEVAGFLGQYDAMDALLHDEYAAVVQQAMALTSGLGVLTALDARVGALQRVIVTEGDYAAELRPLTGDPLPRRADVIAASDAVSALLRRIGVYQRALARQRRAGVVKAAILERRAELADALIVARSYADPATWARRQKKIDAAVNRCEKALNVG